MPRLLSRRLSILFSEKILRNIQTSKTHERARVDAILDAFFEKEIHHHEVDGAWPVKLLRELRKDVKKLASWRNLMLSETSKGTSEEADYIAAAFELLLLGIALQLEARRQKSLGLSLELSRHIKHFPREKRVHANMSVNLVKSDLALTLMHNLILKLPSDNKTTLLYEKKFTIMTQNIFAFLAKHPKAQAKLIQKQLMQEVAKI